jgi:MFS family permease
MVAEAFFAGRLSDHLVTRLSRRTNGERLPEHRLWLFYPAAVSTAVGLALFGCTVQFNWHWAVGQVALALIGLGIQIGNTITVAYVVDCYPHLVMEVIAFYSFHLNLSAFASQFFAVVWVERNGWALSFGLQGLIVLSAAVIFVPFLQICGGRLRLPKGP